MGEALGLSGQPSLIAESQIPEKDPVSNTRWIAAEELKLTSDLHAPAHTHSTHPHKLPITGVTKVLEEARHRLHSSSENRGKDRGGSERWMANTD